MIRFVVAVKKNRFRSVIRVFLKWGKCAPWQRFEIKRSGGNLRNGKATTWVPICAAIVISI